MAKQIWFGATAAAKQVGTCSRTLHRMRERGELEKGVHWKAKNPAAIRLTYLYNVPAINRHQSEVITEANAEPPAEVVARQPALIEGTEPYDITAADEAVPAR